LQFVPRDRGGALPCGGVSEGGAKSGLPRTSDGFELLGELGSGGMGVVYRARELATGRIVALKVLRHSNDPEDTMFDRFQREAMLSASLSDSRCVFVYGAHSFEGAPAIAMELVEGPTLEQVVARKEPIPVRKAVQWGIELLEALEVAHRAGILHRDVKPSNCFLDLAGRVKLGDFGLSRTVQTNVHLTDKGQFLGSPLYASPEQIRGREVDERSDLYSAAATLFTLLAGRPGWTGTNLQEVFARILSEPPDDLHALRADVPAELESVVARAMDKDPARRFQSVRELRVALHPFAVDAPSADLARRIAAWCVDFVVASVIVQVVWVLVQLCRGGELAWEAGSARAELGLTLFRLFYFTLFEGLWGRGLGKWALGLRVESSGSRTVGFGRAAWRTSVLLAPGLLIPLATIAFGGVAWAREDLGSMVWFAVLFLAPRGSRATLFARTGLHERWSGTRTTQSALPLQRVSHELVSVETRAPLAEVEGDGILDRYRLRGRVAFTDRGPLYLGEDALLERDVWILPASAEESAVDLALAQRERATRLRWLASFEHAGHRWTVLEAPGGESLVNWRTPQDELAWQVILRLLVELTDELSSGTDPISLDSLWIDRSHHLRVLDFRIAASGTEPLERHVLLARFARILLSDEFELPRDMPGHAEAVVKSVLSGEPRNLRRLHSELVALSERIAHVTVQQRVLQVGSSALVMGLSFLIPLGLPLDLQLEGNEVSGQNPRVAGAAILAVCAFWALYAALTRGGVLMRLFGLRLRGPRGRRAGALVWIARMLTILSPLASLGIALLVLDSGTAHFLWMGAALLAMLGGATYTVLRPQLGLVDRLLGTRMVQR